MSSCSSAASASGKLRAAEAEADVRVAPLEDPARQQHDAGAVASRSQNARRRPDGSARTRSGRRAAAARRSAPPGVTGTPPAAAGFATISRQRPTSRGGVLERHHGEPLARARSRRWWCSPCRPGRPRAGRGRGSPASRRGGRAGRTPSRAPRSTRPARWRLPPARASPAAYSSPRYISSETRVAPARSAFASRRAHSAGVGSAPVGLCGKFTTIARAPCFTSSASRSGSNHQPSSVSSGVQRTTRRPRPTRSRRATGSPERSTITRSPGRSTARPRM